MWGDFKPILRRRSEYPLLLVSIGRGPSGKLETVQVRVFLVAFLGVDAGCRSFPYTIDGPRPPWCEGRPECPRGNTMRPGIRVRSRMKSHSSGIIRASPFRPDRSC